MLEPHAGTPRSMRRGAELFSGESACGSTKRFIAVVPVDGVISSFIASAAQRPGCRIQPELSLHPNPNQVDVFLESRKAAHLDDAGLLNGSIAPAPEERMCTGAVQSCHRADPRDDRIMLSYM